MSIAQTIADQITPKAFVMMGARNLMACGDTLQFDVGRNAERITRIRVTLDPTDTYTIRTYRGRGLGCREVAALEGVYVEDLRGAIERATGLYLSL